MPVISFMSTSFFTSLRLMREGCGRVRVCSSRLSPLLLREECSVTADSMEEVEKMERGRGSELRDCADSEPTGKENNNIPALPSISAYRSMQRTEDSLRSP